MPYLCIKPLQLFYRLNSVLVKVSNCVHCVCVWVCKKYFKIYIETQKFKNMLDSLKEDKLWNSDI